MRGRGSFVGWACGGARQGDLTLGEGQATRSAGKQSKARNRGGSATGKSKPSHQLLSVPVMTVGESFLKEALPGAVTQVRLKVAVPVALKAKKTP